MTGKEFQDLLKSFAQEKSKTFRAEQEKGQQANALDVEKWCEGYADAMEVVIKFCNEFYIQQ